MDRAPAAAFATTVSIEVEDTVEGAFATVRDGDTIIYRTGDYGWSGGEAARQDAAKWAAENCRKVDRLG